MRSGEPFSVVLAPAAHRLYKKCELVLQERIKDEAQKIARAPYAAPALHPPFQGLRSHHFRPREVEYRIAYRIRAEERQVEIVLVKSRERFYDVLARLIRRQETGVVGERPGGIGEGLGNCVMALTYAAYLLLDKLLALPRPRSGPLEVVILFELMTDIDEGFQERRYRHVKVVERTIGSKRGTGGPPGVEFLKASLFRPVFPDLWAIRHKL